MAASYLELLHNRWAIAYFEITMFIPHYRWLCPIIQCFPPRYLPHCLMCIVVTVSTCVGGSLVLPLSN